MDHEWFSHTATAVGSATVAIGGVWFFIRRSNNSINAEEREQRRLARVREDSDTIAGWRELMEFKSEEHRKGRAESEKRVTEMIAHMDLMHAAHLKCEREAALREAEFRRASADRDIEVRELKLKVDESQRQMEMMRLSLAAIESKHTLANETKVAAEKIVETARDVSQAVAKTVAATEIAELKEKEARHNAKNAEQAELNRQEIDKLKTQQQGNQ